MNMPTIPDEVWQVHRQKEYNRIRTTISQSNAAKLNIANYNLEWLENACIWDSKSWHKLLDRKINTVVTGIQSLRALALAGNNTKVQQECLATALEMTVRLEACQKRLLP